MVGTAIRGALRTAIGLAILSSALLMASPSQATSTVTVSVSANPAQGAASTITVSGSTDASTTLFVYASSESTCEDTPYDEDDPDAVELSSSFGDPVGPGAFTNQYSFTPPNAGTYTVCAYVDAISVALPDASGSATLTASPAATFTVTVSGRPTAGANTTITVSGSTTLSDNLFVYVASESTCEDDAADEWNNFADSVQLSPDGGDAISAGTFTDQYDFVPPAAGSYTVCAYVAQSDTDTPDGVASATFQAVIVVRPGFVRVVRCPTQFGVEPGQVNVPAIIRVLGSPRSLAGLEAYTDTESYLIAPAGMACAGEVGADGNETVVVWTHGQRRPSAWENSRASGVTLAASPACVGCRAELACPFFAAFASTTGFPCTTGIPRRERVSRRGARVWFTDPPHVAGDGWPSGGADQADGLVTMPRGSRGPVYRATCTLSSSQQHACAVAQGDLSARYG